MRNEAFDYGVLSPIELLRRIVEHNDPEALKELIEKRRIIKWKDKYISFAEYLVKRCEREIARSARDGERLIDGEIYGLVTDRFVNLCA